MVILFVWSFVASVLGVYLIHKCKIYEYIPDAVARGIYSYLAHVTACSLGGIIVTLLFYNSLR